MEDFSLYVLDITMNSVRAGATKIDIQLLETEEMLTFSVRDNGCGMTKEMTERLTDPFFTTRKTRKVGLGVPFLKMLSDMTGGSFAIHSVPEAENPEEHGTYIEASFGLHHIDFIPLGDMVGTLLTLIQGSPEIDFEYLHRKPSGEVRLSCQELKGVLGEDISLASYEILAWIKEYLEEGYAEMNEKEKI